MRRLICVYVICVWHKWGCHDSEHFWSITSWKLRHLPVQVRFEGNQEAAVHMAYLPWQRNELFFWEPHRYKTQITNFPFNTLFGNRVTLNPGLHVGGVRDVASAIISHEQILSNWFCCFQTVDAVFPKELFSDYFHYAGSLLVINTTNNGMSVTTVR